MTYQHWFGSGLRVVVLALVYALILTASLTSAMLLRFDLQVPPAFWERFWFNLPWILALKLILLAAFGQFRSLLSYFSLPDAGMIAAALGTAALVEAAVWFLFAGVGIVPRGVIVSDMVLGFTFLAAMRTLLRIYRERILNKGSAPATGRKKIAIVGAGPSAAALLRDIASRPGLGLDVVCLLTDEVAKIGSTLHGKPVMGPVSSLGRLAKSLGLQKAIIATTEAKPALIKELVRESSALGLELDVLPSVSQLVHRQVTVSHLRHVEMSDLLGREEIQLDEEGIGSMCHGQTVLVTGAGGSIGSELCRQLASLNPARLLLVERSEPSLFAIEQELRRSYPHIDLVPRAYDICSAGQMERFFSEHAPAFVFQAAAHKHVPLMEEQPEEAIRNNVLGTAVTAQLASRYKCRKFVLISTDKAANPCNVMGASKRLAEMVLAENQKTAGQTCAFSAVRFGNVLGSSGSVVTIFHQQIAAGGPITVTHPEATRFFMSLPEAVGLILQSALQSKGGEIFVLDMGVALRIQDLACQMIELSGLVPDEDIKIAYTGLRKGERLHEDAVHLSEKVAGTVHPKVKRLKESAAGESNELVASLFRQYAPLTRHDSQLRDWLPLSSGNTVHR
jgi:FlaA1/EpsC-like NDP-sugar epimerase